MALSNKIRDTINRLSLLCIFLILSRGAWCQAPLPVSGLKLLGTRSWIRAAWQENDKNIKGFNIYWSTHNIRPGKPSAIIDISQTRYYIYPVKAQTRYYVWIESFNNKGNSKAISGSVFTKKSWSLDTDEANNLYPPSSKAVPRGMKLFWHDEFNDALLNKNKWYTNYYSTIDFLRRENFRELIHDSLPQAAYSLNGQYIDLLVNDSLPARAFSHGKKISSIQTYNWSTNENLLDNSRGGYFEVRVRRGSTGHPEGLNTAFWFDSPGPDLKYYLPNGAMVDNTKGIRPKGQLFEIDIFENLNAQFVMHGSVDSMGRFIHNLATDIATDYKPEDYVPGGKWVTFGILWTPVSIKHFINGKLIKSYDNKRHIYSPDHFMNILLGSYGKGGTVNMEVDYIRGYQWPVSDSNELPNPGFEANNTLLPWEGTGSLSAFSKHSGKYGILLKPHEHIEQYVYLNNNTAYQLKYWFKGNSTLLRVEVDNVKPVTGQFEDTVGATDTCQPYFLQRVLRFKTGKLYDHNMKTIRISFCNMGNDNISLDDIVVNKRE